MVLACPVYLELKLGTLSVCPVYLELKLGPLTVLALTLDRQDKLSVVLALI